MLLRRVSASNPPYRRKSEMTMGYMASLATRHGRIIGETADTIIIEVPKSVITRRRQQQR